jgi:uncharacterized protein YcbK (DUF882 family)
MSQLELPEAPRQPLCFPKGSDERVGPHFLAKEFDCPCDNCSHTFIDPRLPELLERFRQILGVPLVLHRGCGYRCEYYEQRLRDAGFETAKKRSTHEDGKAADISTGKHSGRELEAAARKAGFRAVGVGHTFVHVDTRADRDRRWTYRT